jgi:hypothetical protein
VRPSEPAEQLFVTSLSNALQLLWHTSPAAVLAAGRNRLARRLGTGGAHPPPIEPSYRQTLIHLFAEFVREAYSRDAMPQDEFTALVSRYQNEAAMRPNNRYFGDLWDLFAPDYRDRLDEYYAAFALHDTMSFLGYAHDAWLVHDQYVRPYRIARERLDRLAILEVGAGIPHGFLYTMLFDAPAACARLTINEIDAPYTRFTEWFCRREGVPFGWIEAVAAKTTPSLADRGSTSSWRRTFSSTWRIPWRRSRRSSALSRPTASLRSTSTTRVPASTNTSARSSRRCASSWQTEGGTRSSAAAIAAAM